MRREGVLQLIYFVVLLVQLSASALTLLWIALLSLWLWSWSAFCDNSWYVYSVRVLRGESWLDHYLVFKAILIKSLSTLKMKVRKFIEAGGACVWTTITHAVGLEVEASRALSLICLGIQSRSKHVAQALLLVNVSRNKCAVVLRLSLHN